MTQIAFLGHDAAHRQIFVSGRWNEWASLIVANLIVGLSYGWWQSKHTRHHANPNKVGVDPDIGANGARLHPEVAASRKTPAHALARAPAGLALLPAADARGPAPARRGGQARDRRRHRSGERSRARFLVVRLGSFLALVFLVLPPGKAAAFIGVELALFGVYMGASFAPNHKGMPIVPADVKIDFLRRQVLTSRNVTGGRLRSTSPWAA